MPSSAFVYKTTIEYSVPADTESGRYYWTSCYFWESDFSNPIADPSSNLITSAGQSAVSDAVTIERRRYERVYGPGTLLFDVYPGPNGNRTVPGCDLLHNTVFVWSGRKNVDWWWKRFRCVLAPSEVLGGVLAPAVITWFEDNVIALLADVPLVNYKFQPVGPISISPAVHHWVWRNGTKRRSRNVLGPYID